MISFLPRCNEQGSQTAEYQFPYIHCSLSNSFERAEGQSSPFLKL
jgi:hypothetical protein